MKVAILGLDSLDADRVRSRYDFPSLLLSERGKIDLEGLTGAEVHTKVIWPIMLDGNHPSHGEAEMSVAQRLSRLVQLFRVPEPVRQRLGSAFDDLPVFDGTGRDVALVDTFLGRTSSPAAISLPGISEMSVAEEVRRALSTELQHDKLRPSASFWRKCRLEHAVKRAATLAALEHTDVVMTHFYALDAVQHVAQDTDEERVEAWYGRYAELVDEVLNAVGDDGVVVVLSDHGMEDGVHGPAGKGAYAYAASSRELGFGDGTPVSDVAGILGRLVDEVPDPEESEADEAGPLADRAVTEDRREHLKDLGYF